MSFVRSISLHRVLVCICGLAVLGCDADPETVAGLVSDTVTGTSAGDVANSDMSVLGDLDGTDGADGTDGTTEIDGDDLTDGDDVTDSDDQTDGTDALDSLDSTDASDSSDGGAGCLEDQCDIDGVCYDNQDENPDNGCERCVVLVSAAEWTPDDSAVCDDGSPCTEGDACSDGECSGAPIDCDDGEACTVDACNEESGACEHAPAVLPCDDGDPCTVDDQCVRGSCSAGAPLACDDGDPCTTDSCLEGACAYAPASGDSCDDGDPCTLADACVDGVCTGAADPCDDENECTLDTCVGGNGCVHQDVSAVCADDNPCTDDGCDAESGCVYPFNTASCDDGSLCTAADTCANGICVGQAVPVDDGNPCTNDACDPAVGVTHTNNQNACDDGNACTLGDMCVDGECVFGPIAKVCEDDSPCTDDGCNPDTGCEFPYNTDPCDDGTVCTQGDTCAGGECVGQVVPCDDNQACTEDACDPVEGCTHTLIVSNACRPTIVVNYPPRGSTINGTIGGIVSVTGAVAAGEAAVSTFTLNGEPVVLAADGTFSHDISPESGGNTLVFEAEDGLGGTRKVVQSFLFGDTWVKPTTAKQGMVSQGLGIWLSDEAISELNALVEGLVAGIDIGGSLPNPIYEMSTHKIRVKNLSYNNPQVQLFPVNGGLQIKLIINNISADVEADGKQIGCVPFVGCTNYPDVNGDLSVNKAELVATVNVSVQNNELVATVGNVSTNLSGANISIDSILSVIIDPVLNLVLDALESDLEDAFSGAVEGAIEGVLEDALGGLAISFGFDLPSLDPSGGDIPVSIVTDFFSTTFSPDGGAIVLRTGAYTTAGPTNYASSPNHLGVPRSKCNAGDGFVMPIPKTGDLELVLADDTANSLLYAGWRGGLLEFDAPPELLGDVDLSELNITDLTLSVSGMLSPTLSDCGGEPTVHIGDLRVDASLSLFGVPMDVVMYVSFEAGVEFSVEDGELGFGLTEVTGIALQTEVVQEDLVASESVIEGLVAEELVPGLLAALGGGALASFPLPEIDLGGGAVIAIEASDVTRVPRHTVVSGGLE